MAISYLVSQESNKADTGMGKHIETTEKEVWGFPMKIAPSPFVQVPCLRLCETSLQLPEQVLFITHGNPHRIITIRSWSLQIIASIVQNKLKHQSLEANKYEEFILRGKSGIGFRLNRFK